MAHKGEETKEGKWAGSRTKNRDNWMRGRKEGGRRLCGVQEKIGTVL